MQLVDIHSGSWSDHLCNLVGITTAQLSPIKPAATCIAEIKPEICQATNLTGSPVLVNGGHDQGCTAVGLGVISPGKLLLACGTAWVLTGVVDSLAAHPSPPAALDLNFHPAPRRWTISQSLGGLGASLEWWVNQAWQGVQESPSRQAVYAALDEELSAAESGSSGPYFLPLTGGHSDPATTQRGGFVDLQLGHTRANMAQAIMESAAFELRWAIAEIQEAKLPVDKLWMVGGAAQSPHWPHILADVLGIPIYLPQYDNWPALGAAILAGVGLGHFENVEAGQKRFKKPAHRVVPDKTSQALYDRSFMAYQQHTQRV